MPIRALEQSGAAVARLSSLRFKAPIEDVAIAMAEWLADQNALLVPINIPLPRFNGVDGATSSRLPGVSFFQARAKEVRSQIATARGLDSVSANKLTFTMSSKDAWYLGPRPNLDKAAMVHAVRGAPAKFIELMLKRELVEAAAFDAQDTFVTGGFGPGVYLGSASQSAKRRLHLAEAEFTVNAKHGHVLCDLMSKVFARKSKTGSVAPASATLVADAGKGFMVGVTRLVPDDFIELDARRYPMVGVSLDLDKIRQTRLYYLNLLVEFSQALFLKAGVDVERATFVASHVVDEGFVALEPLANLVRPLVVVNATSEPLDAEALKPLQRLQDFFPGGYHVAGNKKAHFEPFEVRAVDAESLELTVDLNYLFLNGEGDDEVGSVRVAKKAPVLDFQPTSARAAYAALAQGNAVADPYTEGKFRHLMNRDTVTVSMQGLDFGPAALALLQPGKAEDKQRELQEALKRCLVELSLKECLLGCKSVPTPSLPDALAPASLTLIATRQIRMGKQQPKQLVSVVDVEVHPGGITVKRVRRSAWAEDAFAAIDFVTEFPFLQPAGQNLIRDGQFWAVDRETGERITVWSGAFVPRIILNDDYVGIEVALAAQSEYLAERRSKGSEGRFYSKGKDFNLLPYYMSMYRPGEGVRGERMGARIPVQDCGTYLRVFVPPDGGISGSGDSLSGMRDVMLYRSEGDVVSAGLLDSQLVLLYLHTLTNGVLVGGDNSKMSVLEKLARLALEN
jgi:hypothetical protein